MARDIIGDILTILVVIVSLMIIFMLLWKIFGNSPTLLDLLITTVVGIVLHMIKIEHSRGKFEGRFETFAHSTKESFNRVKKSINNLEKEMKNEISAFKNDMKKNFSKFKNSS